jgi:hypothetical protein
MWICLSQITIMSLFSSGASLVSTPQFGLCCALHMQFPSDINIKLWHQYSHPMLNQNLTEMQHFPVIFVPNLSKFRLPKTCLCKREEWALPKSLPGRNIFPFSSKTWWSWTLCPPHNLSLSSNYRQARCSQKGHPSFFAWEVSSLYHQMLWGASSTSSITHQTLGETT